MSNPFDVLAEHANTEYDEGKTVRASNITANIVCEIDTEKVDEIIDRFAQELCDYIKVTVEY